jgi:hypothetical protein
MKNRQNLEILSLEQSLETAVMVKNIAERIFNNASVSEPGYINASIYLSNGAQEMINEVYKSAKRNGMTRTPRIKKDLELSNHRHIKMNIKGIITCVIIITIVLIAFSPTEKKEDPNTKTTTSIGYEIIKK